MPAEHSSDSAEEAATRSSTPDGSQNRPRKPARSTGWRKRAAPSGYSPAARPRRIARRSSMRIDRSCRSAKTSRMPWWSWHQAHVVRDQPTSDDECIVARADDDAGQV